MKKNALVLMLLAVMVAGVLLAGCGGNSSQEAAPSAGSGQSGQAETPAKVFTAQELSQYDGSDGHPAYVAVDGVVYDVTGSSLWPQGSHSSCPGSVAGRDLSEVMKTAPERMRANLRRFPVVGTLQ
jgi:predicted heme/steroid binding protein